MRKRFFVMMVIAIILFTAVGCKTGSTPNTSNPATPFIGTWEAVHIWKSGYTDATTPIAVKQSNYTLEIKSDGSFVKPIVITFVDGTTQGRTDIGSYKFTDTDITFTATATIVNGVTTPVQTQPFVITETYLLVNGTLIQKKEGGETPDQDATGHYIYPMLLTFLRI
jgi:hypothetical protein